MTITRDIIIDIINSFAYEGKLFSNERQFQLEFAWRLREKGYTVLLEVLEDSAEKNYVDIVVELDENQYVAIELKYTTMQKKLDYHIGGKIIHTYSQGAGDERRYEYLKDIQRIEKLMNKKNVFEQKNAHVVKGYAIIMTNDGYSMKDGEDTKYKEIALNRNRKLPNKEMSFEVGKKNKSPIVLEGDYVCNWMEYKLQNALVMYYTAGKKMKEMKYEKYHPFEYMVMEVKKEK